MIMLEPSSDVPLNIEACAYYSKDAALFDEYAQRSLRGLVVSGVQMPSMNNIDCQNCRNFKDEEVKLKNMQLIVPYHLGKSSVRENSSQHSESKILRERKRDQSMSIQSDEDDEVRRVLEANNHMQMDEITSNEYDREDTDSSDFLQKFKRMKYDDSSPSPTAGCSAQLVRYEYNSY